MAAPPRQDTTLSQPGSNSSTRTSLDDHATDPSGLEKSRLSELFIDAFHFGEVIADENGTSPPPTVGDLVGREMHSPELAATERYAKISVNSWLGGGGLGGSEDQIADEPEPIDEEDENDIPAEPPQKDIVHDDVEETKPPVRADSLAKLSDAEIVQLLIDEFGTLTTSEDDEERLIFENDAVFYEKVAILGMVHLTTHRLSFHASLLSTRPDLLPEQQIIKTGAVTIHRPGLHRKRRIWLELSHDMLTSFPSSSDDDRIKPIKSIMLCSVKEVLPEDPLHPRRLMVIMEDYAGVKPGGYAEFDTTESAREWRSELQGALYLYRHHRAAALYDQSKEDEMSGVRISIPLSRVHASSEREFLSVCTLLKVEVSRVTRRDIEMSEKPRTSRSEGHTDTGEKTLEDSSDEESDSDEDEGRSGESSTKFESTSTLSGDSVDGRTLEFGAFQTVDAWKNFDLLVQRAKEREAKARIREPARTFVDFGVLTFTERVDVCPENSREGVSETEKTIRRALSLVGESEIWFVRSRVAKSISSLGYFVLSPHYMAYWTKCFAGIDSKMRVPISQIAGAKPVYRYRFSTYGVELEFKFRKPISFDFTSEEIRNEVISRIASAIKDYRSESPKSGIIPPLLSRSSTRLLSNAVTDSPTPLTPKNSSNSLLSSPPTSPGFSSSFGTITTTDVLSPLSSTIERAQQRYMDHATGDRPKVINLPRGIVPAMRERHFVCLTIGSRGDVQPYIALAKGLQKRGQKVTIVTHAEYKEWVEGWGVQHRTAGGDPGALMKLSVEHKMFSPQFFKESLTNFRSWLDELLVTAWEQCKDADVLLESPVAMAGVHIAEALKIPYFRVFTMPWTKTTQFPHPFLSAPCDLTSFNSSTYVLFDNVFWAATSGQVNRWRKRTLQIESTDMDHLAQSKITFIYNFSPSVVSKPIDWGDAIIISGYWFLDNPDLEWVAPPTLIEWMQKARDDEKPIVYIGFGSITVPNPPAMTRSIIKGVLKSGVRAIISKGWSSRMSKPGEEDIVFPPECYSLDKVPHDWLFPQIDAVLHHGGAGTTGASLRAGIPTIIKPWFGDQYFWASRVQKLGAGLKLSGLRSAELSRALIKATTDETMKRKAAAVGEKIRAEDGVTNAIKAITTYLSRAGRVRTELVD